MNIKRMKDLLTSAQREYNYPHDRGDEDPFSRNTYYAMEYLLEMMEAIVEEFEKDKEQSA